MLDTMLQVAQGLIGFLSTQWGDTGKIVGYVVVYGIPFISILIEVAEFIVALTPSKEDDVAVSKVRAVWAKVLPWMEALPHVNLPLSPVALKVMKYAQKGISAVKAAIQGWMSKE